MMVAVERSILKLIFRSLRYHSEFFTIFPLGCPFNNSLSLSLRSSTPISRSGGRSWWFMDYSWRFMNYSWRFMNNPWRFMDNPWRLMDNSWRFMYHNGSRLDDYRGR